MDNISRATIGNTTYKLKDETAWNDVGNVIAELSDIIKPAVEAADWEIGGLHANSGSEVDVLTTIRTGYKPVGVQTSISFTGVIETGRTYYAFFYDSKKAFIARSATVPYAIPSNAAFVRFVYGFTSSDGRTVEGYGFDNLVADADYAIKNYLDTQAVVYRGVGESNSDLNNYRTTGFWNFGRTSSTTIANIPTNCYNSGFVLIVVADSETSNYARQITINNGGYMAVRSLSSDGWQPWTSNNGAATGVTESNYEALGITDALDLGDGMYFFSSTITDSMIANLPVYRTGLTVWVSRALSGTDNGKIYFAIDRANNMYYGMEYSDLLTWMTVATVNGDSIVTPGEIFNLDLRNQDSYTNVLDYDTDYIGTDGYTNPEGWENRVQIDKYVVSDYVAYRAHIKLGTAESGVCALGTVDSGFTGSKHATIVTFDFENGLVSFLTGAEGSGANIDGTTIPGFVYDSFELENLSGREYRIEIGRKNRCPYAKVFNLTTGTLCGEKILEIYETSSSYGTKAGALYDFPTFGVLNGTITFKRVSATVPTDVYAAFMGDSITEGSQLALENVWANKCIEYLGSGINLGRGGGNIDHMLRCAKDILPAVKAKYAIVTIGTNGGNTPGKLRQLINLIKTCGTIPIVNCIPMKSQASVESVNNNILALDTDHIRFDIATAMNNNLSDGQNASLFNADLVHPNAAGGVVMYNQFLATVGFIKDDLLV